MTQLGRGDSPRFTFRLFPKPKDEALKACKKMPTHTRAESCPALPVFIVSGTLRRSKIISEILDDYLLPTILTSSSLLIVKYKKF